MKIERITLRNISSIEGEQIIDFTKEPLKSTGLYAIIGKNTSDFLIDAICLALYNRTPYFDGTIIMKTENELLKTSSQKNVNDILHKGSSEGNCSIIFSLINGNVFEASWSIKLSNSSNYAIKRTLRQIEPTKKEFDAKIIDDLIVQLTHLSYNQFTKTVILAQKEFATFLQSKQDDKYLILEHLTGTEVYGNISKRIYEETNKSRAEYNKVLETINGITTRTFDDDTLRKIENDLTLEQGAQTCDEEAIKEITRKLQWHEKYKKVQAQYEKQKHLLAEARKQYNALFGKQQMLERFDVIQVFSKAYFQIKNIECNIGNLEERIAKKRDLLQTQTIALQKATSSLETALNRLEESEEAFQIKEALFNTGHYLQGQILIIEEDITLNKADRDNNQENLQKKQQNLSAEENLLKELVEKKKKDIQRINALALHRRLIEQIEYVKVQLDKMYEIDKETIAMKKNIDSIRQEIQVDKSMVDKLKKESLHLDTQINTLKDELLIHIQANQGIKVQDLILRLDRLQNTQHKAKSALLQWQRIEDSNDELEEKKQEIQKRTRVIEQLQKDIAKQESQNAILCEELEIRKTTHIIGQSEKTTELRYKLKEGTICPICGSMHHPYHAETEHERLPKLTAIEIEFENIQSREHQSRMKLEEMQRTLAKEIGQLELAYQEKKKIEQTLSNEIMGWKDFENMNTTFVGCSPSINRNNRKILIKQLHANSVHEICKAQNDLDTYNSHQEAINELHTNIVKKEEAILDLKMKISKYETNIGVLENQLSDIEKRIDGYKTYFESLQNSMNNVITIPFWKTLWTKDHVAFIQYLSETAETWHNTKKNIQEEEFEEFRLQEKINVIIHDIEEKQQLIGKIISNINAKQLAIEHHKMELRKIFGDKGLEDTKQEMKDIIQKNKEEEQKCHIAYNTISALVQNIKGELNILEVQKKDYENDLLKIRSDLDIEISRFNRDNSTLQYFELAKFFDEPHDWNAIRNELSCAKDKLQRAEYHGEALQRRIAELRQDTDMPNENNEESEPVLKTKLIQIESKLKENQISIEEKKLSLKLHQQSLIDIEHYIPIKEKLKHQLDNWEKLNDTIGSSDGNTFRKITQTIMFSVLVGFANQHLSDMNSRYRLRCEPSSLNLDVIDRDMLDQIRNINTLTQGETFTISLALALGLSSVYAKGNTIGSYFIYGGLDTLDNDNLEIAIETLLNLQNPQQKIGIIHNSSQTCCRISQHIQINSSNKGKSLSMLLKKK